MICYETWLNGRRLCTAGIPGYGVLGVTLSWVKRDPTPRKPGEPRQWFGTEEHSLAVGGLFGDRRMMWFESRRVRAGDVLPVRILRRRKADPPESAYQRAAPPPDTLAAQRSEARFLERRLARLRREIARRERLERGGATR